MSIKDWHTYYRLTEYNDWEGETWYHYFVDSPGVFEALKRLMDVDGTDYTDLSKVEVSDEGATVLANIDEGYMQPHWFGELDLSKLAPITDPYDLYKGKIRDYAEDLFETARAEDEEVAR